MLSKNDGLGTYMYKEVHFEALGHIKSKTSKKIITFIDDEKYIVDLEDKKNIAGILCTEKIANKINHLKILTIITENPRIEFFELQNQIGIYYKNKKSMILDNMLIDESAYIDSKNVLIENNVKIGKNVKVHSGSIIKSGAIIGDNSVIGNEGFEFKREENGHIIKINHYGGVIIEENVEIKEMCSIHKALFDWDNTVIGKNTKVDANTHIGHGTKIGKENLIGAGSNITGNVLIGDYCYVGPGSIISNRCEVGNFSKISIGSVVTKNVEENSTVSGNFAIPHQLFMRNLKKSLQ